MMKRPSLVDAPRLLSVLQTASVALLLCGLMGSSSAFGQAELKLDATWMPMNGGKMALRTDGTRVVAVQIHDQQPFDEFKARCAAIPDKASAAENAPVVRLAKPGKIGSTPWCVMATRDPRLKEPMVVLTFGVPRKRSSDPGFINVVLTYLVGPDAWTDRDFKRDVKALRRGVVDRGGAEARLALTPSLSSARPVLPYGCGIGLSVPEGWALKRWAPWPKDGDANELVFEEQHGLRRKATFRLLRTGNPNSWFESFAGGDPDATQEESPTSLIFHRTLNGTQYDWLLQRVPEDCAGRGFYWLALEGPVSPRSRATLVFNLFTMSARPIGLEEYERLVDRPPRPLALGPDPKGTRVAKKWVKRLSGAKGMHYDSRSADRSTGRASDGYMVGGRRDRLSFCPDGSFAASTYSEMYVSTPFGGGSSVDSDSWDGFWGVVVYDKIPYLVLWQRGGRFRRFPLKVDGKDVTHLRLAGGNFVFGAMRPGGCSASVRGGG